MPIGQIEVPFPTSSQPGIRSQESGGRIINGYIEPLSASAPSPVIRRRAPGLRNFATTVRSGFRGGIEFQASAFTAWENRLVRNGIAGGAAIDVGAMAGTAKGFFARNNRVPSGGADHGPDLVFVDPDGNAFSWDPNHSGTAPAVLVRPAGMGVPNSVCCIDGFFVFTLGNGQVWSSDLNDLTIQPLAFATAESKPDGLTRGLPWTGNLFLMGPATTEVWANVGTSPFPFQRSVVIPRGIAGPYCVAGFEDNFSRALCWVADDNTVVRLNGYQPEKISPPDLDGLIEDVTDKTKLEMSVYMARGHAFLALSASKASPSSPWPEWTWVFDLNNDRWAERNSHLRARSRIVGGFYAFNKWMCGDLASGSVYEISDQVHTEALTFAITGAAAVPAGDPLNGVAGRIRLTIGSTSALQDSMRVTVSGVGGTTEANGIWSIDVKDSTKVDLAGSTFVNAFTSGGTLSQFQPLRFRLESGAVENFPVGARVGRFDAEFVTGVGVADGLDPIQTDPTVEISWSDDGGQTYYAPIQRKLGRQAQTRELVSLISCTGRSGWTARRWRIDVSDPVHVGFMAAYQNVSPKVSDIG